jgi:hypothetical protein
MAIDTSFGEVRKFEDFLVTEIGDLTEIDINGAVTVSTTLADGRARFTVEDDNVDEVIALSFGGVHWIAGATDLKMEARLFISDITDYKVFVGFGDTIASGGETSFSATTDTVTLDTMTDAIGILFDMDATTQNFWCVAGATDVVTENEVLSSEYNAVAATAITLGVWLSADRKSACWYINGKEVHRLDSSNVLVGAVGLVPGVWCYEQANDHYVDVDYLYGRKGRATT